MKKIYLLMLCAAAAAAAHADYLPGYYNAMDGKSREALKAAAKQCVENHTMLNYTDLPDYWQYSDVYPDLVNGCKRWWDMYSDNVYLISKSQTARSSFSANKMQREHSVPKSWWKNSAGSVEYTPAYSDMWNLYPSDGPANQAKSNYPFGICASTTFDNGVTKVGRAATGYGGGSSIVFEPGDEYKGDFARGIFYMATVYSDLNWVYTYMFRNDSYPSLQTWAYQMLLQWARQDPVDQKEIDRNDAVEKSQGNRNPFVDFPELAEYIWGTRTSETFYIAEQGGTVTPPLTGDPEIIRPVNGEALDFAEVAVGQVGSRQLEITARNLTSPLSLRIVGENRDMFTTEVTTIPAADLNTADVYRVQILYTPTSTGTHTATLNLYDGGLALGHDVAVTLQGQAFPVPTLSTLTAYEATGVTSTSYTARWSESPETVDFYVVNRVQYFPEGPQATTLTAEENWLEIDDRDLSVAESYTVQASRLGYLSPVSNAITVNAGETSVSALTRQPLAIGTSEGGITVLSDNDQFDLRIYDAAGTLIQRIDRAPGGTFVELPAGIYIVVSEGSTPLKARVR